MVEVTTIQALTLETLAEEAQHHRDQGWKDASPPVRVGITYVQTMYRETSELTSEPAATYETNHYES